MLHAVAGVVLPANIDLPANINVAAYCDRRGPPSFAAQTFVVWARDATDSGRRCASRGLAAYPLLLGC